MASFGIKSRRELDTCHILLQHLFEIVVEEFDCSILEGFRGADRQNQLFDEGKSKVRFPAGQHNSIPSKGVDVLPYPINWEDTDQMHYFAGYVKGIANGLGIKVRWGGDWNDDKKVSDEKWRDLAHFELHGI